jgi:hypothetical protein
LYKLIFCNTDYFLASSSSNSSSPSQDSPGKTTKKYAKYNPVNNLLAPTYGAAAARDPKNIKVKKIPTNSQNAALCGPE